MSARSAPVIHPDALIDDGVHIGARTTIWEQARVREGARIGDDCVVGRGAYIDAGVPIGDRVKIQNNALIYHGVSVASAVFIGPAAVLTNDRVPRSVTGDGQLAHALDWTLTETRLGEGCSIGAGVVVIAGSDIGDYAMVGAGSVVTRVVPAHALVAGNPARQLGWTCRCGQRLVGPDGEVLPGGATGQARCPACSRPYAIDGDRCQAQAGDGT